MQHTSCISRRSWVLAGPHYKYFARASWGGWKVRGWLHIRPNTTRDQSLAQQRTRSCKVGIPWDLWWRRPHQGLRSPWHHPEMPTCMDVAGSCCKDHCCLHLVPWYKCYSAFKPDFAACSDLVLSRRHRASAPPRAFCLRSSCCQAWLQLGLLGDERRQ